MNRGEAEAAVRVVMDLQKAGITPDQIGVISPYAAQVIFNS